MKQIIETLNTDLEIEGAIFEISVSKLLKPWSGNPRKVVNPAAEEIKASLFTSGFNGVLEVTREADSSYYIPRRGGNTRVAKLLELIEEYGVDSKWGSIEVKYSPWPGKQTMVLDALIENHVAGGTNLIDDAISAYELIEGYFESERRTLSDRELSEKFSNSGWKVTPAKIALFTFIGKRVIPHCPNYSRSISMMNGGKGPTQKDIKRLKDLFATYAEFTTQEGLDEDSLEVCIGHALAMTDAEPDFNLTTLQAYLDKGIAQPLGKSEIQVKDSIDELNSAKGVTPNPEKKTRKVSTSKTSGDLSTKSKSNTEVLDAKNVKPVRGTGFDFAHNCCQLFEIPDDCLIKINQGLGFYLEVPAEPLNPLAAKLWWLLNTYSGVLSGTRLKAPELSNSQLSQVLRSGEAEALQFLGQNVGANVLRLSSLYEVKAELFSEQPELKSYLDSLDNLHFGLSKVHGVKWYE